MENHPLNPMTDANLVRFLSTQSTRQVGLLSVDQLGDPDHVRRHLRQLPPLVITDSTNNLQLDQLAEAVVGDRLTTGGSAIAGCIAQVLRRKAAFRPDQQDESPFVSGPAAVLSGSCSKATRRQVEVFSQNHPTLQLDVANAAQDDAVLERAKQWAGDQLKRGPLLITTTTDPEALASIRNEVGRETAAALAESMLSELAHHLVELGVRRLVVAGGETSGAVTKRLGVQAIRIGPEITPGVPWTEAIGQPRIALALKSGNFGSKHFFQEAIEFL